MTVFVIPNLIIMSFRALAVIPNEREESLRVSALVGGPFDCALHSFSKTYNAVCKPSGFALGQGDNGVSLRARRGVPLGLAHCSLGFFDCACAPLRMTVFVIPNLIIMSFRALAVIPNEREESLRVSALVGGPFDCALHSFSKTYNAVCKPSGFALGQGDNGVSLRACRGVPQVKQSNEGILRLHFVSLRMTGNYPL